MESAVANIINSRVQCNRCGLRTTFNQYSNHQKKINTSCDWCAFIFTTQCDLYVHVRKLHRDKEPLFREQYGYENEDLDTRPLSTSTVCVNCGEIFPSPRNLDYHLCVQNIQTELPKQQRRFLECATCHNEYDTLPLLVGHVKSAHADEEAAMPCSVCSVIFTDRDRLFEHLEKHVLDGSESAGVFYECCVCRLKFSEMAALDVHIKLHRTRRVMCPVCRRRFKEEASLKLHMVQQQHKEFNYCCMDCDETFDTYRRLVRHEAKHKKKKEEESALDTNCLKCTLCPLQFETKEERKKHLHVEHKKEMLPYGCSICEKCFRTAHALQTHMFEHFEAKNLKCDMCDKTFTSKSKWKYHKSLHATHVCTECGKKLSTPRGLRKHLATVHSDKEDVKSASD